MKLCCSIIRKKDLLRFQVFLTFGQSKVIEWDVCVAFRQMFDSEILCISKLLPLRIADTPRKWMDWSWMKNISGSFWKVLPFIPSVHVEQFNLLWSLEGLECECDVPPISDMDSFPVLFELHHHMVQTIHQMPKPKMVNRFWIFGSGLQSSAVEDWWHGIGKPNIQNDQVLLKGWATVLFHLCHCENPVKK